MMKWGGLLVGVLLVASASTGAAPGGEVEEFHAYLLPETTDTEVDSVVPVEFYVDSTAHHFNGYEVTIRYDPEIVAFEAAEEGSLMENSCPNTFWVCWESDTTITCSHVLLCAGLAIDGPGVLSVYRFRALQNGVSPVEIVSDPDCTFFDAGVCVNPSHPEMPRQVIFHDAVINVGPVTGVDEGRTPALSSWSPLLTFRPNPARSGGLFEFTLDRRAQASLEVVDATGRLVFRRVWAPAFPGRMRVTWDGRDLSGRSLPSGVYWGRLHVDSATTAVRAVLIR